MKYQFNKQIIVAVMCGVTGLFSGNALASVSFNSYATVNFSVVSINGASSDYSGLTMFGSFMRSGDDFPEVWTYTSGDASVTDNNPEIPVVSGPVVVGSSFSHTFAFNGDVSDGFINLNHLGAYELGFSNAAAEPFDITLNFSYEISSTIDGQDGFSDVTIEYYDDAVGGYYIDNIFASSEEPELASAVNENSSQLTFTLDQNTSRIFNVDVAQTATLEASPVPLPATAWMFLSGLLGVLGVKKRRITMA